MIGFIIVRDTPCKQEGCTEKESKRIMEQTKGYCIKHNLKRILSGMTLDELEEVKFRGRQRSRFDR